MLSVEKALKEALEQSVGECVQVIRKSKRSILRKHSVYRRVCIFAQRLIKKKKNRKKNRKKIGKKKGKRKGKKRKKKRKKKPVFRFGTAVIFSAFFLIGRKAQPKVCVVMNATVSKVGLLQHFPNGGKREGCCNI